VVIDTNQPTIVPPPALLESASSGNPSPLQSYASVGPSPIPINVAKKRPKANKQRDPGAATYQPTLSNTRPVARGGSATSVPSTSLSSAQIMSGQLLRNLFNLHRPRRRANYVSHPGERFNALNNPAKPSGRRHGLRSTIAFGGSTFLLFFDSFPFFDFELLLRWSRELFVTFIEFGSCP
jgi:hypothetical protein